MLKRIRKLTFYSIYSILMISKSTNQEWDKKTLLAKNAKTVLAWCVNNIDGIKYKLDFGRNMLLFDFCWFAANRLNDELFPQWLLLWLELALHDFLETEEWKKDQKKTNSLRSHFTAIASLFWKDFGSEFKKKFNEIHKTDWIFWIINSILSWDDDKVILIAEAITSTEPQWEDTKWAVLQSVLSIWHKVRVLESEKYIKWEIIDTSAGNNLLIINTNDWRLITKFRWEVNHIKSPERHIETTESIESKIINSIDYFQRGKSYHWANIWIIMPNNINWESFKLTLREVWIQIKCWLTWNWEWLWVFVYPTDYSKLSKFLTLADDAGCKIFHLDWVWDSIPLLKEFTGKWGNFKKYSSSNIDRGYEILTEDESDWLKNFSSMLQRCCLEHWFIKWLDLLQWVADRVLIEEKEINLQWLLNNSNLHDFINGDSPATKKEHVIKLLELTKKFQIKNDQIDYLIQEIQSPYKKSSYSFEYIHEIMGTDEKGYPQTINAENVKLVLDWVSKYYYELWIPIDQSKYRKWYDKIFICIMQYLGFKIEKWYSINLNQLNDILLEFKKYWVDEADDYDWAKRSREEILKKIGK